MKLKPIACCLLALLIQAAHAEPDRQGTLKAVTGPVSLTQAGTVRTAEVGGGIGQADRIVTGAGASTTLMLKDGTIVAVGPNTTLELAKVQFDTTTQDGNLWLQLLQGSIRVVTGWLGKLHPEQVRVTTPTTVVGVRGTDFIVEAP